MVTDKDVLQAYERIHPYIRTTPLIRSAQFPEHELYLKLECEQITRSFKLRGALSRMTLLTPEQKSTGVMTVSSGNHGAAVSFGARMMGIGRADIIVPQTAPESKTANIESFGGTVVKLGSCYDEAHTMGEAYKAYHKLNYIDAYNDDVAVYGGQGTVGLEILQQLPDVDQILVPIGGGSLITGIGAWVKAQNPRIRVIGLQTDACPAMEKSITDNVCYAEYPSKPSLCDALVGGIGRLAFAMHSKVIDDVVVVSEASLWEMTRQAIHREGVQMEPSSALYAVAAQENPELFRGRKTAVVISGGNISRSQLQKLFPMK